MCVVCVGLMGTLLRIVINGDGSVDIDVMAPEYTKLTVNVVECVPTSTITTVIFSSHNILLL